MASHPVTYSDITTTDTFYWMGGTKKTTSCTDFILFTKTMQLGNSFLTFKGNVLFQTQ